MLEKGFSRLDILHNNHHFDLVLQGERVNLLMDINKQKWPKMRFELRPFYIAF